LEPPGAQTTPRNARVDFEDVDHVISNIGPSAQACIATKARTSVPRGESVSAKQAAVSKRAR